MKEIIEDRQRARRNKERNLEKEHPFKNTKPDIEE